MIGLPRSGCDEELEIVKETETAYLVKTEMDEEVWLPKSAFDEDDILTEWGEKIFMEKLENVEWKQKQGEL